MRNSFAVSHSMNEPEAARKSAYLRQVNFYRHSLSKNFKASRPDCPWKDAHQS